MAQEDMYRAMKDKFPGEAVVKDENPKKGRGMKRGGKRGKKRGKSRY